MSKRFTERGYLNSHQTYENLLNFIGDYRKTKTTKRYQYIPTKMAKSKKYNDNKCWQGWQGDIHTLVVEVQFADNHFGKFHIQ